MNYNLIRLNNNIDKSIPINETYSFTQDELKGTDLLKLDDVKINGDSLDEKIVTDELIENVKAETMAKFISEITVQEGNTTKKYGYENTQFAKIELNRKTVNNTNITIKYQIKISKNK